MLLACLKHTFVGFQGQELANEFTRIRSELAEKTRQLHKLQDSRTKEQRQLEGWQTALNDALKNLEQVEGSSADKVLHRGLP